MAPLPNAVNHAAAPKKPFPVSVMPPSVPAAPSRVISAGASAALPAPLAMSLASTATHGPAPPPPQGTHAQTPPFLTKLYNLVEDSRTVELVSWTSGGVAFTVHKPDEFGRDVLPRYFKHNNFSSFVRQLNQYGFHKRDPDRWTFGHDNFRRNRLDLLRLISRRRPKPHSQPVPPAPKPPLGATSAKPQQAVVELGNFGLAGTLDSLKRDKDVLIKELVITRKAEHKLQEKCENLELRVDMLENSTKQMQSFILHYFSQVLQPYSDEIATRKRKRLPPASPVISPVSNFTGAGFVGAAAQSVAPAPAQNTSLEALRRMMQQMQMSQAAAPVQHAASSGAQSTSHAFAPATVQELPFDEALSVASAENSMKSSVPSSPANASTLPSSSVRVNGMHAAVSRQSPPPDPGPPRMNEVDMTFLTATNGHQSPDSLSLEQEIIGFSKDPNVSPLWMEPAEKSKESNGATAMDTGLRAKEEVIEEFMDLPDDLELLPPLTALPDGTDMSALARQIQGFTDSPESH